MFYKTKKKNNISNKAEYPDIFSKSKAFTNVIKKKSKTALNFDCAECQRELKDVTYSVKNQKYYCNYPCFIKCISEITNKNPTGTEKLLIELFPYLDNYNAYFIDDPNFQISVVEDGISLYYEGTIKIYWSYNMPIVLNGIVRDLPKFMSEVKPKFINFNEISKANIPIVFAPEKHKNYGTLVNIPQGHSMELKITSLTDTEELINLLFQKYSIINDPTMFSLMQVSDVKGRCKLFQRDKPLVLQVKSGPKQSDGKIYICARNDESISAECAEFIGLPITVLRGFLDNLDMEEKDQISLMEDIYEEYHSYLVQVLTEKRKLGEVLEEIDQLELEL